MSRNETSPKIGLQTANPFEQRAATNLQSGTLLWIGCRDRVAFRDAFEFCERNVSQIAYRESLEEAIERPASDVRAILSCHSNDSTRGQDSFRRLTQQHPIASIVLLLGPLCAGCRPSPVDAFGGTAVAWHAWKTTLPALLQHCGFLADRTEQPVSLVIVSRDIAMANSLLAIAETGAVAVAACAPESLSRVHHFDEYWWDDSAIDASSFRTITKNVPRGARHVWVSSFVTPKLHAQAIASGFDQVITKPGDFRRLIQRIAVADQAFERNAA
ncbi:hypothetical protein [Rhodopirellula sp. MGV]|uniref:hypothetical protein n=1 Tax=Rhodopirellula sp. MGV TaxID=2023130 RepID=UPI000BDA5D8F|nr:hypothetical protein [Rhodopirellula sp. MGV]OYP34056.1 hypothetical protein CGZ80_16745 [Rhodopirellula sp. MGV]